MRDHTYRYHDSQGKALLYRSPRPDVGWGLHPGSNCGRLVCTVCLLDVDCLDQSSSDGCCLGTSAPIPQFEIGPILGMVEIEACGLAWHNPAHGWTDMLHPGAGVGGQMFAWRSWQPVFPLALGLVVLFLFAVYERYPQEPAITPRLFSTTTISIAFLGSFIHSIIIWCLVYYLVLYFQEAIQHASLRSAIDAFPLAFTLTPSAIICALLIDGLRRYLWSVWLGWLLCTVGVGTMTILDYQSNKAVYSVVQIAPGIGTGFLLSALAVPLQASMTVEDTGVAMGTLVFFRALGSVVGVALGSAIFTNEFQNGLDRIKISSAVALRDASDAVYFLTKIRELDLSAEARGGILQLYASPVRTIWITVSCLAAVGLVSSFFMKELTLKREEMGKQAFQAPSDSSVVRRAQQLE